MRQMADTMTTPSGMDMALKDNGIIVDMSQLAAHTLRSLKEKSPEEDSVASAAAAAAVAANNSMSPTNLSTSPTSMTTFRCERCDNFETNSRASLLLHVVQCLSSPARLKAEEPDHDTSHPVSAHISHMDVNKMATDVHPPSSIASSVVPVPANGSSSSPAATSSSASSSSRKVFECDVCNMKFSNGANMRRHKMRHTGVKPYECRVCQKRFFRKDHLAEHFTTHTKTLPYHCPICNRGFQRQIAMRAHFQNEHVGQHDLVKTCPLCSYRAGSMKSLRIHFFNRHGIDLDNPGPGGTSSLLLALESQASQVAAAAAAAGFVPGLNAVAAAAAAAVNANAAAANMAPPTSHQSDSGESMRSMENATPPMHFLTPHVEISTLPDNGAELYNGNSVGDVVRDVSMGKERDGLVVSPAPLPLSLQAPPQEHPMDCNAKSTLPSSTSSSISAQICASPKSHPHHHDNHITPSISLIPIKQQEPPSEDMSTDLSKSGQKNSDQMNGGESSESEYTIGNNRLTSLIKVSPLKSLLREDLKRRICAKANNRITRNAAALENNNVIPVGVVPAASNSSTCNSTPICNGTITSTGQESDANALNRKQILTCHFCGIEFPDETLYFLHKGCHCESNPWKCNICGEQCNNVYEFNSHLLSKSHQ